MRLIVTEVGRQPWIVYNILRTADAVTPRASSAPSSQWS
jgi:cytochrome d ubiquinol oxidase subunit I